ncbi:MAG: disulfide bond formation protein B [Proteobacteria bacterium]|nr:disulfide bond formation protein B [Pseudomonadota bacterium]
MTAQQVAWFEGGVGLALILGALFFQYGLGYPPCEMCHWQRWPHIAAAVVGLGGMILVMAGVLPPRAALVIALLALLGVAISGGLGVYHAGVEYHWWKGPQACTTGYVFTGGPIDLNARVPMCDRAAWTLFGISLAGFNALISLAAAAFGAYSLARKR